MVSKESGRMGLWPNIRYDKDGGTPHASVKIIRLWTEIWTQNLQHTKPVLPTQAQHLAEEKLSIRNKFWKLVRIINLKCYGRTAQLIF
jgi:hypothetical protein